MLLNDWVEANTRAVAEHYPQFTFIEPPQDSQVILALKGKIAPLKGESELGDILSDLGSSAPVLVQAGRILHSNNCSARHQQIVDPAILNRNIEFDLHVLAFPPKRDPKIFCSNPRISRNTYPDHPHLFSDSSLCAYFSSDDLLPWSAFTICTALDFAALWCTKHHVWEQTRKRGKGVWLGAEASHIPYDLLRSVEKDDRCPCGSGLRFRRCCRSKLQQYQFQLDEYIRRIGLR